jgi:hypothetical protein
LYVTALPDGSPYQPPPPPPPPPPPEDPPPPPPEEDPGGEEEEETAEENELPKEEAKSAGEEAINAPVYQEGEYELPLLPVPPALAASTWENCSAQACSTPSASA